MEEIELITLAPRALRKQRQIRALLSFPLAIIAPLVLPSLIPHPFKCILIKTKYLQVTPQQLQLRPG